MSYFNHAFQKAFLATGPTVTGVAVNKMDGTSIATSTNGGYVTTDGVPTYGLNQLKAAASSQTANGYIGIFDPKTNLTITPDSCCNAYLAGSAIFANDKIGPLAGGYQETNKSKMINPKYVARYYSVAPCSPQNNVIHVGATYWTLGGGILSVFTLVGGTGYTDGISVVSVVSGLGGTGATVQITVVSGIVTEAIIVSPGKGFVIDEAVGIVGGNSDATVDVQTITVAHTQVGCGTTTSCSKDFLCGETYNLRLDVKGSPALRFLDHNAYFTTDAYTGCCPEGAIAPVVVDSTTVMIKWASGITNSPIVSAFVQVVVQDEAGVLWYAPGTSATFLAAQGANTWDNYVSAGHIVDATAGLILNGAYVDTKFGDCTFQLSDFYEVEPVKLYASEVDLAGDPCTFESLCVVTECQGLQVQGLGETILRELTMSESYRQNFLATDLRIREITQGNQIVSSVSRSALYHRYSILHSVPRFSNPSGTFDNDQYLLEVFSQNVLATFDTDVRTWLGTSGCSVCELEEITCSTICVVPVAFPAVPTYNPYNTVSCN